MGTSSTDHRWQCVNNQPLITAAAISPSDKRKLFSPSRKQDRVFRFWLSLKLEDLSQKLKIKSSKQTWHEAWTFAYPELLSEPIKHSRPDKQWVKIHPQSPPGLPLWRARARLPWLSCYCCCHWDTFPPRCLRCHKVLMGGQGEAGAHPSLVTRSQYWPPIGQYPQPRNIRMSWSLYGTETLFCGLCSNYCLIKYTMIKECPWLIKRALIIKA